MKVDLPIGDYALIGDCHSAALVSRGGSVDWCCLPRFDSDSCFGRLLDARGGGHFSIAPVDACETQREYVGDTLVLATTFESSAGAVRLTDFFAMRRGGRQNPRRELVRTLEGLRGVMRLRVEFAPRLDYGEIEPWIYRVGETSLMEPTGYCAVGSNAGLLLSGDVPLEPDGAHPLCAKVELGEGQRLRLAMRFVSPEELHAGALALPLSDEIDAHLDETLAWWREWVSKIVYDGQPGVGVVRSAIVLKALTYALTGAIIAAPTTSLPEHVGGERNWDYRFSWIRDSVFTVQTRGWTPRNIGQVRVNGVDVIHNRMHRNDHNTCPINSAKHYRDYGSDLLADPRAFVSEIRLSNIRSEGMNLCAMRLYALSNWRNIHIENLWIEQWNGLDSARQASRFEALSNEAGVGVSIGNELRKHSGLSLLNYTVAGERITKEAGNWQADKPGRLDFNPVLWERWNAQ